MPDTVDHFLWLKDEVITRFPEMPENPMWGPLIQSLDPSKDVILYPSEDATVASDFDWKQFHKVEPDVESTCCTSNRLRLIVLEATWNHAKGWKLAEK